jgi:hypothetical protein
VVIVPALVRDATGHAIYGLHVNDFVIEDDGVEQPVHLDESAEAEPLSTMVAVQTGRRAWREFGRMRGLSSMLEPILDQTSSQVAVLAFDSQLHLVQDFTDDGWQIAKSLSGLEPEKRAQPFSTPCSIQSGCSTRFPRGGSESCC